MAEKTTVKSDNAGRACSLKVTTIFVLLAAGLAMTKPCRAADERPNILLIVADDMGYSDISSLATAAAFPATLMSSRPKVLGFSPGFRGILVFFAQPPKRPILAVWPTGSKGIVQQLSGT
jgi:hypothetical protein